MTLELTEVRDRQREFLDDVLHGLRKPTHRKSLPSRHLYDQHGCELFERICSLPEYYLTRTEMSIMRRDVDAMAAVCGPGCMLIELGSGSSTKTRLLLDALDQPSMYVPVDIAPDYLVPSVRKLSERYPALDVQPVCADFTSSFELPNLTAASRRVVYFPGSTIGNLHRAQAVRLLANMRRICDGDGGMLVGMDLKKDVSLLEAAYDDSQGVTARFTLNLLQRMQRELGAELDIQQFQHHSRYDGRHGRIEIYLRSTAHQSIVIDDEVFEIEAGELINSEYSYKYDLQDVREIAREAGCSLTHAWLDKHNWFGVFFLEFGEA